MNQGYGVWFGLFRGTMVGSQDTEEDTEGNRAMEVAMVGSQDTEEGTVASLGMEDNPHTGEGAMGSPTRATRTGSKDTPAMGPASKLAVLPVRRPPAAAAFAICWLEWLLQSLKY